VKGLQRHLAHKELPPPPKTTVGPLAWSYCMVLGEAVSDERGTPVRAARQELDKVLKVQVPL
jgi:hypothetical protein